MQERDLNGPAPINSVRGWSQKGDEQPEKKEYVPPAGPGSNSLPPSGSYRDLSRGMVDLVLDTLGQGKQT